MGHYAALQFRLGQALNENYFERHAKGKLTIYNPIQPSSQQDAESILAALGISPQSQPKSFKHYLPQADAYVPKPTMENWFATNHPDWITRTGKIKAKWKNNKQAQIAAIKYLVEKVLQKDLRDIIQNDFHSNCLGGLLNMYYSNSPYLALAEAGYFHQPESYSPEKMAATILDSSKFHPWELSESPYIVTATKALRIAAIKWLVQKLKKDPQDVIYDDFELNRLSGLILSEHYSSSPYAALKEAGLANFHEWEMSKAPHRFYNSASNRIAATKWLVQMLKKDPRELITDDLSNNGLGGLLDYHAGSLYAVLAEAGYFHQPESYSPEKMAATILDSSKFHPWELSKSPVVVGNTQAIRIAVVKWFVAKLNKAPRDIVSDDFYDYRLGGFITNAYSGSPYLALKEAGLVTEADEAYMRGHAHRSGNSTS
jgi:hypothetical protein